MNRLHRRDLFSLEAYAAERDAFRAKMIRHKQARKVHLGDAVTLLFEDRLTIQYQIQEMLRIERIFEPESIQEELDAYNPLIPDGTNLKATMLIEYPDSEERKQALSHLGGIEHRVYAEASGQPRVFAVADEDLDRSIEHKTSAVHFLRFEFPLEAISALRDGAPLHFGIDDDRLRLQTEASPETRRALIVDFD